MIELVCLLYVITVDLAVTLTCFSTLFDGYITLNFVRDMFLRLINILCVLVFIRLVKDSMTHPTRLPEDAMVFVQGRDRPQKTGDVFNKKKLAVIFGTPGAFTPTCTQKHLPSYIHKAKDMTSMGVDMIACVCPNDKYVMEAWSEELNVDPSIITMVSDGNLELATALGIKTDYTCNVMGYRFQRFALVASEGAILYLATEKIPSDFSATSPEKVMDFLKTRQRGG